MMVTMLWYQLSLSWESYLYVSNLSHAWTGLWPVLQYVRQELGLHWQSLFWHPEISHLPWSLCISPSIASSGRPLLFEQSHPSWELSIGCLWGLGLAEDILRTMSICHILLSVFLNPVVREERIWPRGRYRESSKEPKISSKSDFLCWSLYQLSIVISSF